MNLLKKALWESVDFWARAGVLLFMGIFPTKGYFMGIISAPDYYTITGGMWLLLWALAAILTRYAPRYAHTQRVNPNGLPPDWFYLQMIIYSSISLAYYLLGNNLKIALLGFAPAIFFWVLTTLIYGLPKWRWVTSIQRWVAFMPAALLIAGCSFGVFMIAMLATAALLWILPQPQTQTNFLSAPISKPNGLFWVRWAQAFMMSGLLQRLALNKWPLAELAIAAAVILAFWAKASGPKEHRALIWGTITSIAAGFLTHAALGVVSPAVAAAMVGFLWVLWLVSRWDA